MYNRGTKYLLAGRHDKAMIFFKKQLKDHAFKELYLNMANCYKLDMDYSAAEKYYKLANNPDVPFADGHFAESYDLALNNLGLLIFAKGDDNAALDYYTAAIELNPKYGEALWNYSIAELRRTNCVSQTGWDLYGYRFDRGPGSVKIDRSVPTWDGRSQGLSITVQTEQGFGDKIMFARYLPLLKEYFHEVVVMCHPSLNCLYPGYRCVEKMEGKVQVPMGSLPQVFGLQATGEYGTSLVATGVPHTFGSGLNIGVVWTGSATHANNRNRCCPPWMVGSLLECGNLYGINPGDRGLKGVTMLNPKTWTETINYCLGLDVIVSVDTSVVHLAGTLGVPVLMMQPLHETDFRWGAPYGGDGTNVWYPSVTVLENRGWESTIANVKERLKCIKK